MRSSQQEQPLASRNAEVVEVVVVIVVVVVEVIVVIVVVAATSCLNETETPTTIDLLSPLCLSHIDGVVVVIVVGLLVCVWHVSNSNNFIDFNHY